jgi:hypothetical protein
VKLGETLLRAGDGAAVSREKELAFTGHGKGEVILFDLA